MRRKKITKAEERVETNKTLKKPPPYGFGAGIRSKARKAKKTMHNGTRKVHTTCSNCHYFLKIAKKCTLIFLVVKEKTHCSCFKRRKKMK